MSLSSKRLSMSSTRSESPLVFAAAPNGDSEEWIKAWENIPAKDLVDVPVVSVDADTSVEDACDQLLQKNLVCLAVNARSSEETQDTPYHGLFDVSDVNAFLTLAATRHKRPPEELGEKPQEILAAAKSGKVPVYLVSNLSEKNPLEILPHTATLVSLLAVFARGTHRVLIQSSSSAPPSYLGFVSDRHVLSWFASYAQRTPTLLRFLNNPLSSLALPSLYIYAAVITASASDTVLKAMQLMSDEGVSSVAVIDEATSSLLSAVSVTDIGKIIVPAESNHILSTPLHQFVARIKEPDGSTDGVDKFPVYSVSPSSTLLYTIQKLLATDSHRLFVTDDPQLSPPSSGTASGNLCGIVSTVDVLSLFARLANIQDVDPTRMQRHRRASSTSSTHSSGHSSRSSSRGAGTLSRTPSSLSKSPGSVRNSRSSVDGFQWAERVRNNP